MSDAEEPAARFDRVVREYGPALARLAATYTRDAMDRDDLLQEILFAIWRALSRFRGESSERTFVYRIAHNRAITFVTRRRRAEPPVEAEAIADSRPDATSEFARAQRHEWLMAAVRRLPEPQR